MRKLLAEDDRPVETSLAVFRAVRASTAELLERLEEQDRGRAGTHTESGPYTMDDWLEIYAAHAFDHPKQIRRVRGPTSFGRYFFFAALRSAPCSAARCFSARFFLRSRSCAQRTRARSPRPIGAS